MCYGTNTGFGYNLKDIDNLMHEKIYKIKKKEINSKEINKSAYNTLE